MTLKNPILIAKNLRKTYKVGDVETHAVNNVNFTIYEGEFVVILGPSGSGKSTLMNLVGGMDEITSGELYYRDSPVHNFSKKQIVKYRRDVVGFIFQFYNLLPSLTCYENVSLVAELSKNPLKVKDVLDKVGLLEREKHFPAQLSGGQQQRVAIARAIVKAPELLLCDEPTGALDTQMGEQILLLLKKINKEDKKTIIIISHDPDLLKFADRCLVIKDGHLSEKEEF